MVGRVIRPIFYVPDDLEDISEVVRPAAPKEEEPVPIETVTSSPDTTYNADDLEVPAFMRKRGQSSKGLASVVWDEHTHPSKTGLGGAPSGD